MPVEARKVRTLNGFANVCSACGESYPAPPPGLAYHRRAQRKIRRLAVRAEAFGQLRLFPR